MTSKMDPQVQTLLTQAHATVPAAPNPETRSIAQQVAAQRAWLRQAIPQTGEPEAVFVVEDLAIPSSAGSIAARVYTPSINKCLPTLVYYHGGGFVAGDLDTHDTLLRALANAANCLIVSVAYRLAPENPYPAAVDDAWAVLHWVLAQAGQLGGHSQQVGLGGDGAGGYLAALVAQRAAQQGLSLRIQVLLYPNLDARMASASWLRLGTGAYLASLSQMTANFRYFLAEGLDRTSPLVSPLRAENLAGSAPALIVTASLDPLYEEGEAYVQKLRAANIPVTHVHQPGMAQPLASLSSVSDTSKALVEQIATALRNTFAADAAPR